MAKLDKSLQDLTSNAKAYVDLQVDDLKLKVTKGLSISLGRILALNLIILSLFIVMLALAAGCTLLLGQWTGSYVTGAFIMAGIFALLAVILFLRREETPEASLYTVEMIKNELQQIHGYRNNWPQKDMEWFLGPWLAWLAAGSPRDKQDEPIIPDTKEVKTA